MVSKLSVLGSSIVMSALPPVAYSFYTSDSTSKISKEEDRNIKDPKKEDDLKAGDLVSSIEWKWDRWSHHI